LISLAEGMTGRDDFTLGLWSRYEAIPQTKL